MTLSSFEAIRRDMYRLLGDAQDVAHSDWAPGTGPTRKQADSFAEAVRYVGLAKVALNKAADRG